MRTKNYPAQIKAADGAAGTFEAMVSVFGNVDSMGDRVMPGAFVGTLARWAEKGDPIPVIWSHAWHDPDYHVGVVLDAEERPGGLWVRAQLDLDAPKAAQVHRLLKGRRVTQFSFAYDVLDERTGDDGANELLALEVFEVGPTLIGANQSTELLAAKTMPDLEQLRELAREAAREEFAKITPPTDDTSPAGEPAGDEEPEGAKSAEPMHPRPADVALRARAQLAELG